MKNFFLVAAAVILPIALLGQSKISYLDFPDHAVSVAPANIFFDGNGNISYYKHLLKRSETKLKYFRAGTDFFGTFRSDSPKGTRNYTLYTGIENLKKLENFSLILGYELALNYYSTDERGVEPDVNAIFFPQSVRFTTASSFVDRGSFFLSSIIGFIGIKYHLTKHFSVGLESGVGVGHYWSFEKSANDDAPTTSGFITDIDPNRQFVIEYYF